MYERLIEIDQLPNSGLHRIQRGDQDLVVCVDQGQYFVLENRCSHRNEPLHQGRLRNGCIYCPYHGARFDLATGAAESAPATQTIHVYVSRICDGVLEVFVDES